jgi:FtsP/CotA-like multicopper oxidase with cupredoxin domain
MSSTARPFPTGTVGLERAVTPGVVAVGHGETVDLRIAPVVKRIGGAEVRMLAYNQSVPGPTLKVAEGSEIVVDVENQGDLEATVHWHGLRLDNRYDGTHAVQDPIEVGECFQYRLEFPDPGIYWYHPHIRQDYGQEMGLYGTIVVEPTDPGYWPSVHRELVITLDDILIEDGRVAAFSRDHTTYAAMGRFGNHMLVNGEPELTLDARPREVVRFFFVNTANTRVFNVALRGGRMKLVGGDSGRCEHEQFVETVILGPSERAVVDVLFDAGADAALEHRTPERTYHLATVRLSGAPADGEPVDSFDTLRTNPEMVAERERIAPYLQSEPDKTLALTVEMDFEVPEGAVLYTCAMHPEVVSGEPGKCPKCAMKLMPAAATVAYTCAMHPAVVSDVPGKCPLCAMKLMPALVIAGSPLGQHVDTGHGDDAHGHATGAIEWEDDMVDVNRRTTDADTRWRLVDRATGAEGRDIGWRFTVGDQVKIRLVNEMDSDHPMHHPFHIHGAGRFLVLSRDGTPDPNLVWTDTVLARTGEVVDLLLDVTHAGRWMAHCHIAEHHESGMWLAFDVDEPG